MYNFHWLRDHPEYTACLIKIQNYKKGFEWWMDWRSIPTGKANALKIILNDACEKGMIEMIKDEWGFTYQNKLINTRTQYRRK